MAESDGKEVTFVLSDSGKEFDPTMKEGVNTDINPAERDIGGMGIFIVKNIMNKVTYQRLKGKNLLTTIIKTGERIDTMNASQFEQDIQPVLVDGGVNVEMDCTNLTYMASSGLRIIQKTMRTVTQQKGVFKMTNVRPEIYKVLAMTGFTKFIKVEKIAE